MTIIATSWVGTPAEVLDPGALHDMMHISESDRTAIGTNDRSRMTKKADFNAEEWSTVVEGPLLAGMRVITAHRGGTIRESLAMGQVYAEARRRHGESELLDALVSSPPALDQERVRAAGQGAGAITGGLREALRILEQKASPEELEAYRRFVVGVAEAAAKAHKEGGFIGIGGKQVSESEQAALDEIQAALGTTAETDR